MVSDFPNVGASMRACVCVCDWLKFIQRQNRFRKLSDKSMDH